MKRMASALTLLLIFATIVASQTQSPREAYYTFVEARDSLRTKFDISDPDQRKQFSNTLKQHTAKLKECAEAVDSAQLRDDDLFYLGIIAQYSALGDLSIGAHKLYLDKFPRGKFIPIVRKELLKRLATANRLEEASALLPKIQGADFDSYLECLSYIAWSKKRQNDPEGALDAYRTILDEAVRRSGHGPLPHYRLARLLPSMAELMKQLGKTEEALKLFNDVMPKFAAEPDFQKRLGTIIAGLTVIGRAAPALKVERWLNSDGFRLDEHKGKVVLLDFWATWCGPCVSAFPDLAEIQKEFQDQPFVLCGLTKYYGRYKTHKNLSPADEIEIIKKEFLTKHTIGWPLGFAPDDGLFSDYGITSLPTVLLIDKYGNVKHRIIGHREDFKENLISRIKELLAEK